MTESYELAMYFMARHTALVCLVKRGRRGYLFLIGDELAYPKVKRREVAKVIGDETGEDIAKAAIVTELKRMYDVYFIIPEGAYYSADDRLSGFWRAHLGQNVIRLDDLGAGCETIALTVGLDEDAVDLEEGLDHLREFGSDAGTSVSRALAPLNAGRGAVAVSPTPTGLDPADTEVTRV